MSNTQRQPGYYWVKMSDTPGDGWEVAQFDGNRWTLDGGIMTSYPDSTFSEINENRILSPDEQEFIPSPESKSEMIALIKKGNELNQKMNELIGDSGKAHSLWLAIQERKDLCDYDKKKLPWDLGNYVRIFHPDINTQTNDAGGVSFEVYKELEDKLKIEWLDYLKYCGY